MAFCIPLYNPIAEIYFFAHKKYSITDIRKPENRLTPHLNIRYICIVANLALQYDNPNEESEPTCAKT